MTRQERKEWLERYRNCEREIEIIGLETEEWRSIAEKATPSWTEIKAGNGTDRMQAAIERIDDLRNLLAEEILRLTALRYEIESAIITLPDESMRTLLRMRYINCMRIEDISEKWPMEYRHVQRCINRAVESLVFDWVFEEIV